MSEPGRQKSGVGFNPFVLYKYFKIRVTYYKLQLSLAVTFFSTLCYCQSKPLQIGDTLSAQLVTPLTGNQHIILDFFATWCTACIKGLPKLDSLQKQFAGNLQVLLVAQESAEKITAFRNKNKLFGAVSLPIITSDTLLKKIFPHKYIPHEVWVNPQGKVEAVTEALYVNAANIQDWVSGKKLSLPLKADAMDFDYKKPLLQNSNGGSEDLLLFRSLLAHHLKGMGGSEGHITENNSTRWYYINATILSLYKKALGFQSNRIVLEVGDPSRYILPVVQTEDWNDSNLYAYELTAPSQTPKDTLNVFMLHDLNRYLGLNGRMEKRIVKCWALVGNSKSDSLLKTTAGKPTIKTDEKTGNLIFRNQSMKTIIAAFNNANTPSPGKPIILDEKGISTNVDLEIPAEVMSDFRLLQQWLPSHGFILIPVEREIEMFVLTESNYKP